MSLVKAVFPQGESCSYWKNSGKQQQEDSELKRREMKKSDRAGNQGRDGESRPDVMLNNQGEKRITELD